VTRSMTAFACETATGDEGQLTWELRSVNHRYLESVVRLPEDLRALEPAVRERIAVRLARGKLDCTLRFVPVTGSGGTLRVNRHYVEQLLAAAGEVAEIIGQKSPPAPFDVLGWPGVLHEQGPDFGPVMERALAVLDEALGSLIATREREGGRLAELVRERCDRLAVCAAQVRQRMPQVMADVRERILDRLKEVRAELDPNRLEQELAFLAQRLDVDEEMDRMEAHIDETRSVLEGGGPVGRRLDFLMQELNREANTLGSKSSDVEVSRVVVEMKVLIEQMREQVQNIE
jgi:uncharacterized protein (TIGR00255 family)